MKYKLTNIGEVNWTNNDIKSELNNFIQIYKNRPIKNNIGGMNAPHCFATYFLMKTLNKPLIIESGVWKGQSTWLIEQTCPESTLICIDPNLNNLIYKSNKAIYTLKDWNTLNILNTKDTLSFFDDHQNALERIKHAVNKGYKYLIFEDNYPTGQGDCLSLKQIFDSNNTDTEYIKEHIKIYYEFPPIFKTKKTRWNDEWNNENYPTKNALFTELNEDTEDYKLFYDDAQGYTWIAYVELK